MWYYRVIAFDGFGDGEYYFYGDAERVLSEENDEAIISEMSEIYPGSMVRIVNKTNLDK